MDDSWEFRARDAATWTFDMSRRVIVCPPCLEKRGGGEEKACGHGLYVDIRCKDCGAVRAEGDEPWACLG
jgi:ribosomal protein S27E